MTQGLFITFEGGEGVGKSTQIARLSAWLEAEGHRTIATREPGGTPAAEAVRALLVRGATDTWSPHSEALLNYAARDSHVREVIRPALEDGQAVLCDRFSDSTRVYQGLAAECDMRLLDCLEQIILGTTIPDATFILDLDPEIGLQRARTRPQAGEDRFERKGRAFHDRVRQGFLAIARANPDRCHVIDASRDEAAIAANIRAIVASHLAR